jgi:hypothetical protein
MIDRMKRLCGLLTMERLLEELFDPGLLTFWPPEGL